MMGTSKSHDFENESSAAGAQATLAGPDTISRRRTRETTSWRLKKRLANVQQWAEGARKRCTNASKLYTKRCKLTKERVRELYRVLNNHQIKQLHLKNCPSCESRFHFDMRLKQLLHERCTIGPALAHLRAAVMQIAHKPPGHPIEIDPELMNEIRAEL